MTTTIRVGAVDADALYIGPTKIWPCAPTSGGGTLPATGPQLGVRSATLLTNDPSGHHPGQWSWDGGQTWDSNRQVPASNGHQFAIPAGSVVKVRVYVKNLSMKSDDLMHEANVRLAPVGTVSAQNWQYMNTGKTWSDIFKPAFGHLKSDTQVPAAAGGGWMTALFFDFDGFDGRGAQVTNAYKDSEGFPYMRFKPGANVALDWGFLFDDSGWNPPVPVDPTKPVEWFMTYDFIAENAIP